MLELLFLGNSYIFQYDVDVVTQTMFEQAGFADSKATALTAGGYTWALHQEQTETSGTAWEAALATPGNDWDWVILQEQSQIPGFPQAEPDWQASVAAGGFLDGAAASLGSETVLLLTWGRRLGDDANTTLYPDYSTMQDHLTEGYLAYQAAFTTEERPVWIAPAGLAFAQVYADVVAAGDTPENEGTRFSTLYTSDGSHPSPAGTYLVAAVLFETMTGQSASGLPTPADLSDEQASYLQGVADRVVLDNPAGWTYPWQGQGTDTGTDPDDDADPVDETPGGHSDPQFACNAGISTNLASPASVAVVALLYLRRRR